MKCRDCENLIWSYDEGEWIWHCRECYCPDLDIERDCPDFAPKKPDIFTALSTLKAENEKLRAELEQVKIERDAAVSDLEHIMSLGGNMDTCQLCGNAQCHKRGGTKLCLPKWRGQKED